MDKLVISYATAILELQKEEGISSKQTICELEMVYASFDEKIKKFLYSKAINANEKKEVMSKALKGLNKNVINFIFVLIDNYRIDLLKDIIEAYKNLLNKEEGVIRVDVRLAHSLSNAQKEELKNAIKNRFFKYEVYNKIEINEIIDSSILQGLVIEYQGKVLDASLLSKQEALKEYLEK